MKTFRQVFLVSAIMVFISQLAFAGGPKIGTAAPDFSLKDESGKVHKLTEYQGNYVVLEWFNPECPFVKKHYGSGNMQSLQKKLTGEGAVWLSIDSSTAGKQGHMDGQEAQKWKADKKVASTAVLLDMQGNVGKLYGAKTTPHMFVIDPVGRLIYEGAIDDQPSSDPKDISKAKNYVETAFNEARAGKRVSRPSTVSYGCSVKY